MRRIFLMSSVLFVAPFVFGESGEASAQCVATTDCASLGYTEASCPNGGIKCPFGNTWNCKGDGTTKPSCDSSYKYTCTGANQKPGADSCDGKYKSCKCASGYEWKNGVCSKKEIEPILGQCTGYAKNCAIGDILNSDGTCTVYKVLGKKPIGVVVYIGDDNCGQALALEDLGTSVFGGGDISGLPNYGYDDQSAAEQDFDSCGNTQKIFQILGYKGAVSDAMSYAPYSAPETEGLWCLPALGIGRTVQERYGAIDEGLSRAGGELLPRRLNDPISDSYFFWSSTEVEADLMWGWGCKRSEISVIQKDDYKNYHVRPVIMF